MVHYGRPGLKSQACSENYQLAASIRSEDLESDLVTQEELPWRPGLRKIWNELASSLVETLIKLHWIPVRFGNEDEGCGTPATISIGPGRSNQKLTVTPHHGR